MMTSKVTSAHFRQALSLGSYCPHLPRPLAFAGGSPDGCRQPKQVSYLRRATSCLQKKRSQGFSYFVSSQRFPCLIKIFFNPWYCKVREGTLFLVLAKTRNLTQTRNIARLEPRSKKWGPWEQGGTQGCPHWPDEEIEASRRRRSCPDPITDQ